MNRRTFIKFSTAAASAAALTSTARGQAAETPPKPAASPTPPGNPFQQEGEWYKAALHVHTKTSDGDVDVATRLKQYRDLGYHVVAVTDHWKTNDLTAFSDGAFLAINSMEAHPVTGTGAPRHHFVCLDLPHPFVLDSNQKAQDLVDAVRAVGGKVIYAHPQWTTHTLDEMRDVTGYIGIEVYNGHCDIGSATGYNDIHIDQAFNKIGLFAINAVDDIHHSGWINSGWTMIRAKELTKPAIMAAIEAGHFYASTGPTITDFRVEDGTAIVTCPAAERIRFFYGKGEGGGKAFTAKPDQPLTEAKHSVKGRKWVRAEVRDAAGKFAWTGPLVVG